MRFNVGIKKFAPLFSAVERILISVFTYWKPLYDFPLDGTKLFMQFFSP